MNAGERERIQAALTNAKLKAQPQLEALNALGQSAHETFNASVAAGKNAGILQGQAAGAAVAPTEKIFSDATASGEAAQRLLAPVLAALAPDSPYRIAAANEQAAGSTRNANAQARALSHLQDLKVSAAETPAFTRSAALSKLTSELQKIAGQRQSLAQSQGLTFQSEIDAMRKEAEGRRVTERGQDITARGQNITAQSAREAREQKAAEHREDLAAKRAEGSPAGGYLSKDKQTAAAKTLRQIEGEARGLKEQGLSPQQIYSELTNAHESHLVPKEVPDPKTGKMKELKNAKTGEIEYEKSAALPAHDALLTQAGLESVFHSGSISKGTLKKLHQAGYSVRDLELAVRQQVEGEASAPGKPSGGLRRR